MSNKVINPITGRLVTINGPTHKKMLAQIAMNAPAPAKTQMVSKPVGAKVSTRQSPTISATKVPVGTEEIGNDGLRYIVRQRASGVQYWAKCAHKGSNCKTQGGCNGKHRKRHNAIRITTSKMATNSPPYAMGYNPIGPGNLPGKPVAPGFPSPMGYNPSRLTPITANGPPNYYPGTPLTPGLHPPVQTTASRGANAPHAMGYNPGIPGVSPGFPSPSNPPSAMGYNPATNASAQTTASRGSNAPPYAMGYNPATNASANGSQNHPMGYDPSRLTPLPPATNASATASRQSHAMGYDPSRLTPLTVNAPTNSHAMGYDPSRLTPLTANAPLNPTPVTNNTDIDSLLGPNGSMATRSTRSNTGLNSNAENQLVVYVPPEQSANVPIVSQTVGATATGCKPGVTAPAISASTLPLGTQRLGCDHLMYIVRQNAASGAQYWAKCSTKGSNCTAGVTQTGGNFASALYSAASTLAIPAGLTAASWMMRDRMAKKPTTQKGGGCSKRNQQRGGNINAVAAAFGLIAGSHWLGNFREKQSTQQSEQLGGNLDLLFSGNVNNFVSAIALIAGAKYFSKADGKKIEQAGGATALPVITDPMMTSYLGMQGVAILTPSTLIPLGILLAVYYSYKNRQGKQTKESTKYNPNEQHGGVHEKITELVDAKDLKKHMKNEGIETLTPQTKLPFAVLMGASTFKKFVNRR